jgi:hypothetical protein
MFDRCRRRGRSRRPIANGSIGVSKEGLEFSDSNPGPSPNIRAPHERDWQTADARDLTAQTCTRRRFAQMADLAHGDRNLSIENPRPVPMDDRGWKCAH